MDPPRRADVTLEDGRIIAIEAGASRSGEETDAHTLWLAPALVDPHSVLEDPLLGRAETLTTLRLVAAAGGYSTVALLPWARSWRDRPDRLGLHWPEPMRLLQWGSFSLDGADLDLAPHADQLEAGAIGLAGGETLPPLDLLERGLQLREMEGSPILLAPRDGSLVHHGFVRERVEALRAGWPLDPVISETLPLQALLTLRNSLPPVDLRVMNLSTADGVEMLRACNDPPPATVCWWHLLSDSGCLDPADEGWKITPPLGSPLDREALVGALDEGLIAAVGVHHLPLDDEERLLPLDQRRPGVAGHGIVLPLLWQELVGRRGWSPHRLWQVLCWGPARFLGLPPGRLEPGCRRWILFDPEQERSWDRSSCPSLAANQPVWNRMVRGTVRASGFSDPSSWSLPAGPSR